MRYCALNFLESSIIYLLILGSLDFVSNFNVGVNNSGSSVIIGKDTIPNSLLIGGDILRTLSVQFDSGLRINIGFTH